MEQLTSDLLRISNYAEKTWLFSVSQNLVSPSLPKHNLPQNYYIFFEYAKLKPSSVLNILGSYISRDLSWKDLINSLSK